MKNAINPSQVKRYLEEINRDERVLIQTAAEFEAAKTHFEMTLLRYQALRDFVTDRLGQSPYAIPAYDWPEPQLELGDQYSPDGFLEGRASFRFTGMKVGDAIVQILEEAAGPLDTDEIIERLGAGGAGYPDPVQPRAVIAALTHTAGIAKYTSGPAKGEYTYVDPLKTEEAAAWKSAVTKEEGPGDLPFE